ncbi:hypothetical protein SLS54_008947 [Diplodia seriata]
MASPPSTPPAKVPENPDEWRFVYSGALCEFPEDYCPGGFHPVNLGDRFHNGRYRVIRKLGDGAYSIVWLAVDTKTPRYVALKIMVAKASTTVTELSILDHLSQRAPSDPNSQHVTTLLDTFTHTGPNGTHRCMVFEPMGITAASLVEELPENKPKTFGVRQRYPYWMAKKILRHALLGLAFLHSNGVVHGDVQPGNMLFAIDDLSSVAEDELKQDEASTSVQLRRVDGKEDKWAPKTLYIPQPLHDRVRLVPEHLHVKLSDLGASFFTAHPPSSTITPIALRAPELILPSSRLRTSTTDPSAQENQPLGPAIDIWAFGCLIYEFITGTPLFVVALLSHDQSELDDADDDHLTQIYDTVRPLPPFLVDAWPRRDRWFGPRGERLNPHGDGEGGRAVYVPGETLEERFEKEKPGVGVGEGEARVVCGLVRWCLEYDPEKRPGAGELLEQEWFME